MAALYADEDFPHPVVARLRALGHDVLTAQDAAQADQQIPDDQVLVYATTLDRAVLTHIVVITCAYTAAHRFMLASSFAHAIRMSMRWRSASTRQSRRRPTCISS